MIILTELTNPTCHNTTASWGQQSARVCCSTAGLTSAAEESRSGINTFTTEIPEKAI
jgi:hypothetical protein